MSKQTPSPLLYYSDRSVNKLREQFKMSFIFWNNNNAGAWYRWVPLPHLIFNV